MNGVKRWRLRRRRAAAAVCCRVAAHIRAAAAFAVPPAIYAHFAVALPHCNKRADGGRQYDVARAGGWLVLAGAVETWASVNEMA
jgi:hypothetical protein